MPIRLYMDSVRIRYNTRNNAHPTRLNSPLSSALVPQSSVNGRHIDTGNPVSVSLCAQDIVEPIKAFFDMVFKIAKKVLAKLPAEVSADIKRAGIYLVGGTSKTAGLEMYFVKNMNMRANMVEEPDMAAATGGGILAGKKDLLNKLKLNKRNF